MPWIFGPAFSGHPKPVELAELRKFDVFTRARAFEARTKAFFIEQVDVLQTPQLWAPFPLAVMTCIGIEMIGSYKYGDAQGDRNDHFKKLAKDMNSRFGEIRPTPDGAMKELAYFLYNGFRNSLAHGFYGKWVFVTHQKEKAATFRYSSQKRFVVVNVYWFYQRFKEVEEEYLKNLLSATNLTLDPLKTFNETFEKNFAIWI